MRANNLVAAKVIPIIPALPVQNWNYWNPGLLELWTRGGERRRYKNCDGAQAAECLAPWQPGLLSGEAQTLTVDLGERLDHHNVVPVRGFLEMWKQKAAPAVQANSQGLPLQTSDSAAWL
jgi:hypothetical protein